LTPRPRVDVVGLFPGTTGGPSVYVHRLSDRLEEEGFEVRRQPAYPPGRKGLARVSPSLSRFIFHFRYLGGDLIHLNSRNWKLLLGVALISMVRRKKWIITIHGSFRRWPFRHGTGFPSRYVSGLAESMVKRALQTASTVAVVNRELFGVVAGMGIPPDRIRVTSPFIPPRAVDITNELPGDIARFAEDHEPVLLSFGSIVRAGDIDVYGVDLMIRALSSVKVSMPSVGLLLLINRIFPGENEYFRILKRSIKSRGLDRNVMICEALPTAAPLYPAGSVFLRPTSTDGDAISVRESLMAGLPVLASDASPRPRGTLTFKSRDADSFAAALMLALGELPKLKRRLRNPPDSGWREVLSIYLELTG